MDRNINIFISNNEVEVLKSHTLITDSLLKKLMTAIHTVKQEAKVRRVKICFSLKELDKIISFIADKANQKNSSDEVQRILDNMFGRFAEKWVF